MTGYTEEMLKMAENGRVILIAKDDSVWVGTLIHDLDYWRVIGLDYDKSMGFKRSYIKKIIYLYSGYVLPKDNVNYKGKSKHLNLFELNDLIQKAGYQFL